MPLSASGIPTRAQIQAAIDEVATAAAAALVGRLKAGRNTVTLTTTGTPVSVNVAFAGLAFASTPSVTVGAETTNPQLFDVGISSVSTTGFTLTVTRRSGSNTGLAVNWVAAIA